MARRGENIFKRKDGLWEARYVKEIDIFGKKKYGSVYARSYTEVKEKRQDILATINLVPQVKSIRRMTLSELTQEWLSVNKNRLKLSTYQKYQSFYEVHISKSIGKMPVMYLNVVSVQRFAEEELKTGISARTVNAILVFIHTCLKYGNRQYHLPIVEIIYLKESRKEMRVLTVSEQKRLVAYLTSNMDVYKLGTLVALYTGLRVGELCALQWRDITNNCIYVNKAVQRLRKENGTGTEVVMGTPKTNTSVRVIPLPEFLIAYIEPFRKHDNTYFISDKQLDFVEPRVMQYKFKKYVKSCEIEGATFHTLRHTFATRSVEWGFELKSLSEILGHADIKITMNRYVHSSLELKSANMQKLVLLT